MIEDEIRSLIANSLTLDIKLDSDGDLEVSLMLGGEEICSSYVTMSSIRSELDRVKD